MKRAVWDRERVLALLWLVGGALTGLTLVLPYDVDPAVLPRAVVAVAALATGLALLAVPRLPEAALHALLAGGTVLVAVCSSLGMPDVEGVMFLLPVIYAFASFTPRRAAGHLALATAAYALVLVLAADERTAAPWIAFTLVTGVGAVAGVAIALLVAARERARRAGQRNRRIAETLQRTLLPEVLPRTPGVAVAARYEPAADEADVGGDLYDAVELGGGRVAVAIGDVAGKGLPAAAMVGRLRTALRAYALEEAAPAGVLRRLDRLLATEPDVTRMTTLLYAILDPAAGTLTWASAGHPPPLLLPAGGTPRFLDDLAGVPLGVLPRARFADGALGFVPGDRLLLYTDGLVERRGEPLDVGMERLRDAVRGTGDSGALLDAALGVLPEVQRDDVAVLAIELRALGERLELTVPCRPEELAGLRATLRRWLGERCPAPLVQDMLVACSEAATNAVVHAGASSDDHFVVVATARDGVVRVEVRDHGRWRPEAQDDHGHGLALARGLVDDVEVRTGSAGTTVVLEQRLPQAARVMAGAPPDPPRVAEPGPPG